MRRVFRGKYFAFGCVQKGLEESELGVIVGDLVEIGLSLSHDRGDDLEEGVRQAEFKDNDITTRTESKAMQNRIHRRAVIFFSRGV